MFEMRTLLWLIPALPLAAAAITGFFGPRYLRKNSHWPCILAVAGACVLSFFVLYAVAEGSAGHSSHSAVPVAPNLEKKLAVGAPRQSAHASESAIIGHYYTWFRSGSVDVGLTLRADGLTALMLITITFVGSWIAIFAVGYMSHEREHEAGYARFFAAVALFVFSMTLLVLGDNYLVLFAGWEGVGLCSYLLIGFWFKKPSAAAAARKAFLVTRLGDAGMMLGILLLWAGYLSTHPSAPNQPVGENLVGGLAQGLMTASPADAISFDTLFAWASQTRADDTETQLFFGTVALLLLCGAVGKSAQIPLYVWLPDAMEGPTPVSALIHAATMVTAGVYLIARSMPIFHAAPPAVLLTVASIGAGTALLAALIALTQNDLKRVLAYSTISQIGYMFLALGCATTDGMVLLAVTAAIFHLFTHAFFKALLFLSAGSVMHAMGNVIDMRRFSGLRQVLPTTHWTFLCGAGALAGVPLLSGFWSKDEILGVALEASGHAYGNVYMVLFMAGLLTAGLTAFYTFRAYFLTFWGEVKVPPEAGHHAHESPPVMTIPLMVLAVGAVGLGLIVQPFTHWFSHLLEHRWLHTAFSGAKLHSEPHGFNLPLMVGSSAFCLVGVVLAWLMYVRSPSLPGKLAGSLQGLYQLSLNKFHVDELYAVFFVGPATLLASLCQAVDFLVDSLVDLVGQLPALAGKLVRPIQNGLVQFYALAMILGLTVFLSALVLRLAR